MSVMATPPESTKISVGQRLRAHAATHWPQAGELEFRYRGTFVYVEAHLPDGAVQPLIRLRYGGSARHWGFGLYLASSGRYENLYVSRRVLRDLHHYVDIERDELVERRWAAGAYGRADDWIGVRSAGRTALTLVEGGRSRPYSRVTIEERRRLCRVGDDRPGGPLWLWLGEDGLPLSRSTWQAVFRRASERCARFGLDLVVHPHALRHTFAVHMLGLLLRQTVRALRMEPGETLMSQQVKRLLVGDPLRKLQLLLGHRQRETVFVYLDVLDEAQEIVLSALREWDEQAEALSRVRLEDGAAA
jgi:hypothetical protein